MRHRKLGRILDEQVNVVILAIHLDKFCLEVSANFGEQPLKSLDSISIEYAMPILCDEDQVSVASVLMSCYRPTTILPC